MLTPTLTRRQPAAGGPWICTVLSEVDSWPIEDRIRLAQEIWDRLAGRGDEPALFDAIKAAIDRRFAAHAANPAAAIPWERVEAETLPRLRR